jgi:acetyltransferase-like isoleucine patch superfamily enzyme
MAATIDCGASLDASTLDVGPEGRVTIGAYAMVTSAYVLCDHEIEIGEFCMISWSAVVMDTFRLGGSLHRSSIKHRRPAPVRLGANTWVGFEACVLPGVTVGEGSIIGARAVVSDDVPAYTIVAGNPARVIRRLNRSS